MSDWRAGVRLPAEVTQALAAPLRQEVGAPLRLGEHHTLPVSRAIWSLYAQSCSDAVRRLSGLFDSGPASVAHPDLRRWVASLIDARRTVLSLVLALAPFEPFDDAAARDMLGAVDWLLLDSANAIEGAHPAQDGSGAVRSEWLLAPAGSDDDDVLPSAFGWPPGGVTDAAGEFSASKVFAAHYLDVAPLRARVARHLASLGLPSVHDVLVGTSAVGWVLSAEDQVAAYCSADAFLGAMARWPTDSPLLRSAVDFVAAAEPLAGQARRRRQRLAEAAGDPGRPEEARMLALAELYTALLEGPFRRYAWVMHCLDRGAWADVPTLAPLREAVVAGGGWLSGLARQAVLTQVRNGVAHETLYWDGAAHAFVCGESRFGTEQIAHATLLLDAFARGCDAASAVYASWAGDHDAGVIEPEQAGRLAPWRRAEAYFGTNGLVLLTADFNARTALVTCARLAEENVNPCLQALVACRRLLPAVERFEVRFQSPPDLVVSVSADALDRTARVWDLARSSFGAMPLSTFLPANLGARQALQPRKAAVRAVAWIALDDVLDALDSSSDQLSSAELHAFARRVEIVALAVNECLAMLPRRDQNELIGAQARLAALQGRLSSWTGPVPYRTLDDLKAIGRIRDWHDSWGPVERLPGVERAASPAVAHRAQALREPDWIFPWQGV